MNRSKSLDNWLVWLIPVLYLFVTVSFYLRTYDSCQIKITALQIGAVSLIGIWLIRLLESDLRPFSGRLTLVAPVLAFLVSGILAFIFSPFPGASFMELIRRISYVGLALMIMFLFNRESLIRRLLYFVVIAGLISSAYGFIQLIDIYFAPPPPEPGFDPFIWRQAFYPRVFSTHGNPNFFADFLVVLSPILLALILKTKSKFLIFLFLLVTLNVVFTYSKAGWIGYTSGVVAFALLTGIYFSHAQKQKVRKFITIAIILLLLVCTVGVAYFVKQRTDSVKFRVYTWLSTWEMILKRPVLGSGIGTFYVTYPRYRRPQIFFVEAKHNTETDHPENEYIEVWYDEGLLGFGIFLWLIVTYITVALRSLRQYAAITSVTDDKQRKKHIYTTEPRAYYILGILSSFFGMLMHNLMCVSLRFVSSGIFLGYLIGFIGLLATSYKLTETKTDSENKNLGLPLLVKRSIQGIIIICLIYLNVKFVGIFRGDMEHNIAIFYSKRGMWNEALTHYNNVKRFNPFFIMTHYFMGNVFNDRLDLNRTHHPEWGDREIKETEISILQNKYKIDLELGNREFRFNPVTNLYDEYRNDAQRAIDKYDDVKRIAPNYVQVHHQTGLVYMKLGDGARQRGDINQAQYYYRTALDNFEKYRYIDPIFMHNYSRMAYVYMQLGDWQKAEQTYLAHLDSPNICKRGAHSAMWEDWSVRRKPEYAESYVNLGNIQYLQKRYSAAEKSYRLATELNSASPQAWRNLAILYKDQQRYPEALSAWQKVYQLKPDDPEAKQIVESIR